MGSGNMSPSEVKSTISSLEISPSKHAANTKIKTTGCSMADTAGTGGSPFKAKPPGYGKGKSSKK